jgi:hypothetical protein
MMGILDDMLYEAHERKQTATYRLRNEYPFVYSLIERDLSRPSHAHALSFQDIQNVDVLTELLSTLEYTLYGYCKDLFYFPLGWKVESGRWVDLASRPMGLKTRTLLQDTLYIATSDRIAELEHDPAVGEEEEEAIPSY